MADRILVFVPAYNCGRQIGRTLAQLEGPAAARVHGVLVLDNGSRDDTVAAASAAIGRLAVPARVGRNGANLGLGGSHKAAFAHAVREGFTHVLVLHGDDQGDVRDILPLIDAGAHRQADALLGSRFMAGARASGYSRLRTAGNHGFNLLFSGIARTRVRDLGAGLNLFGPAVIGDPAVMRMGDDLRFNVFLLLHLIDARRALHFFPVSWREEDQLSNVRLVSQALGTLAIARDFALRRRRFRAADHAARAPADYAFDVVAAHG